MRDPREEDRLIEAQADLDDILDDFYGADRADWM